MVGKDSGLKYLAMGFFFFYCAIPYGVMNTFIESNLHTDSRKLMVFSLEFPFGGLFLNSVKT